MNLEIIEDESHVLFYCDLYQKHRMRLTNCLNKAFEISNHSLIQTSQIAEDTITSVNLKSYLMPILSPNTQLIPSEEHHEIKRVSDSIHTIDDFNLNIDESLTIALKERQSYVVNCVSTFIFHCSEERTKFSESVRADKNSFNNIRINLIRSSQPPSSITLPVNADSGQPGDPT
jgi:hypothetical protein